MVFYMLLYTFYIHPIHIEGQDEGQKVATRKVEDSQYWVTKNGLGGAAYTMIHNHKGGFDSASGMSKSGRE